MDNLETAVVGISRCLWLAACELCGSDFALAVRIERWMMFDGMRWGYSVPRYRHQTQHLARVHVAAGLSF